MVPASDEYDLESLADSLKDESEFFDKYHFEDGGGYRSLAAARYDSYKNIFVLMKYLFGSAGGIEEIFRADFARIFDLSEKLPDFTTFEKLEDQYPDWIAESNRNNTMSEYGQIGCLIGYVQRQLRRKHLLMIVQSTPVSPGN